MNYVASLSVAFFLAIAPVLAANPVRQVDVHDPAMAREGDTFYLYSTGPGIPFYSSKDKVHWVAQGSVFSHAPSWTRSITSAFDGHIWAPDVVHHDGKYYLTYSISGFGKNDSAIGLVVNKTLDPASPNYKWEDRGMVLHSVVGRDLWNAIDSNIAFDDAGTPWMAFGSFWSGIKLVKLNRDWTGLTEPQRWISIAKRDRPSSMDNKEPGPGEIEGPFIFKKNGYYYLFVSTGLCCRGKNSTYRIEIGRSKEITGPYLDKQGRDMANGGGSPLIAENPKWAGWGGNSVYSFDGADYVVFHAYEAADNDFHRLKISKITWDAARWPIVDARSLDDYQGFQTK